MLTVRAHAVLQYCAKVMRGNFDEICQNCVIFFEESEFLSIFRCTYSYIIEISYKRAKFFAWHFDPRTTKFRLKFRLGKQNFVWESEISRNSLFGEQNFVEHFVCWSRNQTECG